MEDYSAWDTNRADVCCTCPSRRGALAFWLVVGLSPTVPISTLAGLVEVIKDPMPASVFWRMVSYANRFVDDHRAEAAELSRDGSFETGARAELGAG